MYKIDEAILNVNKIICRNIEIFDESERGLLSQNILSQLRNFVEYIAIKVMADEKDIDPNIYKNNVDALKHLKCNGKYKFLNDFHELLQISVSHYSLDDDGSERLMLKYYEYLLKIKIFLENEYGMNVLENINDFPLNNDEQTNKFYELISEKIDNVTYLKGKNIKSDRYYIKKCKPFFVNNKIYYEITFSDANSFNSKFDRVIAFTNKDIFYNYSVNLSLIEESITILGKTMNILIIDDWNVSIRPCEINNFAKICGFKINIGTSNYEYNNLMKFIKDTRISLSELIKCDDMFYNYARNIITNAVKTVRIFEVIDKCREIVLKNKSGCNVILYLLHNLNNKILKEQTSSEQCSLLSNLYLEFGCIPFDTMPFCTSLLDHNPRLHTVLSCIDITNREHELLARLIKNNTEIKGVIFTDVKDIIGFDNIDELLNKYNNNLYYKHTHRKLCKLHNYLYIKGYAEDCHIIVNMLKKYTNDGIAFYKQSVQSWLNQSPYNIDSHEKIQILESLFIDSKVALIYGAAGTGKSTLMNHIAHYFYGQNKVFLANTHPAVKNLQNKITVGNSYFSTIASYLSDHYISNECDILFIDECSTVSNKDMKSILEKTNCELIVLVGDIYQIESVTFGNWFNIVKNFISKQSIFELKSPYRTESEMLLTIWDRVRTLDIAILEPLVKERYSVKLDESIFAREDKDEIILCLNYDGLYGINNINRFLQNDNPNKPVHWGVKIYKIGDPVLFNEVDRFNGVINNNTKGKISEIEVEEDRIWFTIELDFVINSVNAWRYDFELLDLSEEGNSMIKFYVKKHNNTDDDDDYYDTVVPFQVAYAISIHKSQGLEYNSVKVVINNEIEEKITHNIFYTAITRAKNDLKIYWSPETENNILSKLSVKNPSTDINLLSQLYSLNKS